MGNKKEKFDIIVIGAGAGGLNIASFMNKVGLSVLLIDKDETSIGGDCLNFGCVPSKALIHIARIASNATKAKEFGLEVNGKINMRSVKQYIKEKQGIIRKHENSDYLNSLGIKIELGFAKFASEKEVEVNGKRYKGKKIVIATGSRPRMVRIDGMEQAKIYTNETIFDIENLPQNLVIMGGGPIGIEIGQAFKYLGSNVSVIERNDQILKKEDPEISDILLERLKKDGINFYLGSAVLKFSSPNEIVIETADSRKITLPFDAFFMGLGRELNIDGLELDKAGVKTENGKIKVDDYLETTNKNVYVCGDAAGKHQFTHAAELHAKLILNNLFSPLKKKLNNDYLSWVTYTYPEVATFGLNETELKNRKIKYELIESDFSEDDRGIIEEYRYGKLKLFLAKEKLLGGTMIAPNAGELFQELVLANSGKTNIKELFNKTYPYPTASRANKKIITKYFARKLTKLNKKILRILYSI